MQERGPTSAHMHAVHILSHLMVDGDGKFSRCEMVHPQCPNHFYISNIHSNAFTLILPLFLLAITSILLMHCSHIGSNSGYCFSSCIGSTLFGVGRVEDSTDSDHSKSTWNLYSSIRMLCISWLVQCASLHFLGMGMITAGHLIYIGSPNIAKDYTLATSAYSSQLVVILKLHLGI